MLQRNCIIVSVFLVSILALSGVLFGQRVIDLDKVWGDMRVLGDDTDDKSGYSVAYGDINGDGYADIIVSAIGADPAGGTSAGETYVIFGSSSPPSTIDLNSQSADITIYGDDAYDSSGVSVASGDVNHDGYDDVIIGASGGYYGVGETYVIFGGSFPSPPYAIDLNSQSADITIYGDDAYDYSGSAVASGDVNGDSYADIIIGAYGADPGTPARSNAGETYVVFGSSSPPSTIDLNSQSADITIYGDDASDWSGSAVASGDVNGDSYDDIIIGAKYANPAGGTSAGETYVIFGGSFPSPPTPLTLTPNQPTSPSMVMMVMITLALRLPAGM